MGTIHKHSTQSRNPDIMTNKNWTCIKMYKNIKRYQKYKNIKVDNNYLSICAPELVILNVALHVLWSSNTQPHTDDCCLEYLFEERNIKFQK